MESNKLAITSNPGEFLIEYSPGNAMKLYKDCYNMEACIRSQAPVLSSVFKLYGEKFTVLYLVAWIINLNNFLNIRSKMTPGQIDETAELIYQDNYYLNIADLRLIFKNIKSGKYPLFESLDGMKLMNIFQAYANERQETSLIIGGRSKSKKIDLGNITNREDFKQIGYGKEKN